jgi:predicted aminopeptidase
VTACFLSGCYTVSQGYHQARLLLKREPLEDVIERGRETPERIAKLKLVPRVLAYGRERVSLDTGSSYTKYVSLDGPSVTYVVQAAQKRSLRFKTWWFPLIGSQPYLGYFERASALEKRDALVAEGYDTSMGGVQAFSMLGYFPDPLYSSMVDGNDVPGLVEVLLHECLHRTVYVPNHSAFNENLADFVAKRATSAFLRDNADVGGFEGAKAYEASHARTLTAQGAFKEFLLRAKADLEAFYAAAERDPALVEEGAFLAARQAKFDSLADAYTAHMAGRDKGTGYERVFKKGAINNAVVLGYSLYEAKQAPFEVAFAAAGEDVGRFVMNMKACLDGESFDTEEALWKRVEGCK